MTTSVTPWISGLSMLILLAGVAPSAALTQAECSAKYQAAKQGGTLAGMKWNDFRKAQCSDIATPTANVPATAPNSPAPVTAAKPAPVAPAPTAATKPSPVPTGTASFPAAISPKYASESAGKARMHTCLDQYKLNKATGANGGMNWIEKGGGYYSECNKHLKS
jgi:hypothetical protein